jgi:hypothetical protein
MEKKVKNMLTIAVFVIVTIYCMMTGWWIFWAGITAMLYIDAFADSTREWLDARQDRYLETMKNLKTPVAENRDTLQSIQQSLLSIEHRLDALEGEK